MIILPFTLEEKKKFLYKRECPPKMMSVPMNDKGTRSMGPQQLVS